MKTLQRTQPTSRYSDPELEEYIEQTHRELKTEATEDAITYAAINKPEIKDDTFALYISKFFSGYSGLIAHISNHTQASADIPEGKLDIKTARLQENSVNQMIKKEEEERRKEQIDLKRARANSTYSWSLYPVIIFALILLNVGEIAFISLAFQVFGDNFLTTTLIGISVGIALMLLAHKLPWIIERGKTRGQRIAIGVLTLLFLGALFYGLGVLRVQYINAVADDAFFDMSPVYFMLVNLLLFAASTVLFYLMPKQEHRLQREVVREHENSICKLDSSISDMKKQKTNIPTMLNSKLSTHMRKVLYARDLERRVESYYTETIAAFVQENILNRSDRITPDCFKQDIPGLQFYYQDLKL